MKAIMENEKYMLVEGFGPYNNLRYEILEKKTVCHDYILHFHSTNLANTIKHFKRCFTDTTTKPYDKCYMDLLTIE